MKKSNLQLKKNDFQELRNRMVTEQIQARGIKNHAVLEAMKEVPRHAFVPATQRDDSYKDEPLPIGYNQTISQPYIVGLMTECLDPQPNQIVLDIGTGSGYQAAVLAKLTKFVYSIEVIPELAFSAKSTFQKLKLKNICIKIANGYSGWPEKSPFDSILIAAAVNEIPKPLLEQLKIGKMIAPIKENFLENLGRVDISFS
ncbi:MAG: protein-L-isoaspartate(D-aspartate) O-methyltransferase [Bdellovibrionota bacterium]